MGKIFKPLGTTGRVPPRYVPSSAQTFGVDALLIKESDADLITIGERLDPALKSILYHRIGGQLFLRKFVHPLETERSKREQPKTALDGTRWFGTPTSSTRSLLIASPDKNSVPFIAKTSLRYVLGGVDRRIDRGSALRAVQTSAYYDEMMKETGGRIPNTDKTWTYFAEPAALGMKGSDSDYTIMRSLPADYSQNIYLPFYALIGEREAGGRWIDELYAASGYGDKLEFVWNEIARPLLEFHLMVNLDHGMVTELHQQNALVRIDPTTKRILGVSARDMDGHSIDYIARKHLLNLSVPPGELGHETSSAYGYHYARQLPMLGYEYFKDSIFKNVMKYFLDPSDVRKLVGLGNETMLRRFNRKHAAYIGTTPRFLDLKAAFHKLYAKSLPPAEAEFFLSEEKRSAKGESPFSRLMKNVIFGYYKLKQRLERGALPSGSAYADERVEPLLERIREDARGIIPEKALDHWLFLQRHGHASASAEIPLNPETAETLHRIRVDLAVGGGSMGTRIDMILAKGRVSTKEMRSIALQYAAAKERALRRDGATRKAKLDFIDEEAIVARLNDPSNPHWYTFERFNVAAFAGLLGLPINIVGLEDKISFVDGYELPPTEFIFHDELHSLAAISGLNRHLKERGVRPGSPEFYEYVLERVRFTKKFLAWADGTADPVDRMILKALWFDAFHEHFSRRWPAYRHHENFAVSSESLKEYVAKHIAANGRLKPLKRIERMLGRGPFHRFVAGDFLAPTARDAASFTPKRILSGYKKLGEFANENPSTATAQPSGN